MIDLLDAAAGRDFRIPGANLPVRLSPLTRSSRLVRFPPGWARPEVGHYLAGEEFVVLEGELLVSGVTYRAGHHAWLPAGTMRHDSRAPRGALALACFDAEPTWVPSELDEPDGPSLRTPLAGVVIPEGGLRLTPHSLLFDRPAPLDRPAELVTVGTWTWQRADLMPLGRVLARFGD
ncbi:hypothetical protein OIE66_21360 [Nonomuraea sp. NBC_01738]|uniref:hypothetical protein n=1 Tax=Nonomuraea sp. NBC_01738 TaxID=2976003 RepID=UPI002E0EAB9F|nr:hypothetical protein OIE66_21360 [Nonomuraea sp. NBC_01738]